MWTCKTHGPRKEPIVPYAIVPEPKGSDYFYATIDGTKKDYMIPVNLLSEKPVICDCCEDECEWIST